MTQNQTTSVLRLATAFLKRERRWAASIFFAALSFSSTAQTEGGLPERELSFELEPVAGAKSYEVKITNTGDPNRTPVIEKITTTEFAKRLPLGSYDVETRSIDRRGVAGSWHPLGTVDILFKPPTLITPKPGESFKASGASYNLKFMWESFHPEATYTFELKTKDGDDVSTQAVKGTELTIPVKPGQYVWALKSLPPAGTKVDASDPAPAEFSVDGLKLADPKIDKPAKGRVQRITWVKVENATAYKFLFSKIKGADGKDLPTPVVIQETSVADPEWPVPQDLEPGMYRFAVTATAEGFENSKERFIAWKVRKPIAKTPPPAPVTAEKEAKPPRPVRYSNLNLATLSFGPVLWKYTFTPDDSNNAFDLMAITTSALSADGALWTQGDKGSHWGLEVRGRQTNVYLFKEGSDIPGQEPVTVADRRIAMIGHYRIIHDTVGTDFILGYGTHRYTYLIQDSSLKILTPIEGDFREYYIGGAVDWRRASGSRGVLDLTFHPVSASETIQVLKTQQFTFTARFNQNIYDEKVFLVYNFENIKSTVSITAPFFEGAGVTSSTWYRFGLGLGAAF